MFFVLFFAPLKATPTTHYLQNHPVFSLLGQCSSLTLCTDQTKHEHCLCTYIMSYDYKYFSRFKFTLKSSIFLLSTYFIYIMYRILWQFHFWLNIMFPHLSLFFVASTQNRKLQLKLSLCELKKAKFDINYDQQHIHTCQKMDVL